MNGHITPIPIVLFELVLQFPSTAEAPQMESRQDLTAKQQSIVPIAAFTANGDMERLKTVLNEGLDAGLTVNEIKEILVQMYAYAGFPRSLNGIHAFITVLESKVGKQEADRASGALAQVSGGGSK